MGWLEAAEGSMLECTHMGAKIGLRQGTLCLGGTGVMGGHQAAVSGSDHGERTL